VNIHSICVLVMYKSMYLLRVCALTLVSIYQPDLQYLFVNFVYGMSLHFLTDTNMQQDPACATCTCRPVESLKLLLEKHASAINAT
jgi:hypothetical protein